MFAESHVAAESELSFKTVKIGQIHRQGSACLSLSAAFNRKLQINNWINKLKYICILLPLLFFYCLAINFYFRSTSKKKRQKFVESDVFLFYLLVVHHNEFTVTFSLKRIKQNGYKIYEKIANVIIYYLKKYGTIKRTVSSKQVLTKILTVFKCKTTL